jgi:hypothetical protein
LTVSALQPIPTGIDPDVESKFWMLQSRSAIRESGSSAYERIDPSMAFDQCVEMCDDAHRVFGILVNSREAAEQFPHGLTLPGAQAKQDGAAARDVQAYVAGRGRHGNQYWRTVIAGARECRASLPAERITAFPMTVSSVLMVVMGEARWRCG